MSQAYPVALVKLTVGSKVFAFRTTDVLPVEYSGTRSRGYLKRFVTTNPTFGGASHLHWDRLRPTTQLAIEACEGSLESFLWGISNFRSVLVKSGAYRLLTPEQVKNGERQAHIIDDGHWGQLLRNRSIDWSPVLEADERPWVYTVHRFELMKVKLQCVLCYTDAGTVYQAKRMGILTEVDDLDWQNVSDANLGVFDDPLDGK